MGDRGCANRSLQCDLLVGADGIGSALRAAVAPGISPRAAGYAAWRGVAQTGESTVARASQTIGHGQRFGLLCRSAPARTYWFAVLAGGDRRDDLDSAFASSHPPIAQVLAATAQSDRSYLPLGDLRPLPRWSRDHLVLVGDAAHAMTPNLGQGAGQALEDIVVLRRRRRQLDRARHCAPMSINASDGQSGSSNSPVPSGGSSKSPTHWPPGCATPSSARRPRRSSPTSSRACSIPPPRGCRTESFPCAVPGVGPNRRAVKEASVAMISTRQGRSQEPDPAAREPTSPRDTAWLATTRPSGSHSRFTWPRRSQTSAGGSRPHRRVPR